MIATKKSVTVKMLGKVKRDLPVSILQQGYNMRQKSLWVSEAIESLLAVKDWEGALLSELETKTEVQDVFTIPTDVIRLINKEIIRVESISPRLKANTSSIIRAAINRRLLGFYRKSP